MPAKSHRVKINRQLYVLKFGNKALRVYEREAEASIADLYGKTFGVGTITYLLHAGMVYDHPEVTLDDLDEMIDEFLTEGGDITVVTKVITEALAESGWFANPTKASASTKDSGAKPAE
jgi:hypothetical protein